MSRESKKKSLTEKLSDAAAGVNKTGADNFEKLAGELQRDIPKIAVGFHEKIMELDVVDVQKRNSKLRYQRALDAGLEEAMAESLREVREKNVRAGELRKELAGFSAMIEELYGRQRKILDMARESQVVAADKVREAEKLLKSAEQRVQFCYSLQGSINSLNTEIADIIRGFEKEKKTFEAEIKFPRDNSKGFWLEADDPFAQGSLRIYQRMKDVDGLSLPLMLNFKDKEKVPVDAERLRGSFEKSEALKSEFGDLKTYIEFESLIVVQILRSYVLRANGGGDRRRGFVAEAALQKCR